jgi:trafficking protein particle complex subunit 1
MADSCKRWNVSPRVLTSFLVELQIVFSFRLHLHEVAAEAAVALDLTAGTSTAAAVTGLVMTVHSFYLFDRHGMCLCYREWSRTLKVHQPVDDQKTMFGMLFALRNFSSKLSPTPANGLPKYYATDVYALHYFETPTGLRFVLTTSKDFGAVDVARHLREIYADVFVDFVVKNPLYVRGTPILSELFLTKLDAYVQSLPCF